MLISLEENNNVLFEKLAFPLFWIWGASPYLELTSGRDWKSGEIVKGSFIWFFIVTITKDDDIHTKFWQFNKLGRLVTVTNKWKNKSIVFIWPRKAYLLAKSIPLRLMDLSGVYLSLRLYLSQFALKLNFMVKIMVIFAILGSFCCTMLLWQLVFNLKQSG